MDFAPRDHFDILKEARLHAMISCVGLIGSPHPVSKASVSPASTEGQGTPGRSAIQSSPGVSEPFNLDACFKMGEGK